MEEPSYSSLSRTLCSKEQSSSSEEESGWTSYFEDFLASEKRRESEAASSNRCSSSFCDGSSMVSDAASCARKKHHQNTGEPSRSFGNLSLKRKKGARKDFEDESLEDTASSPVSSPKVGEFSLLGMNTRKKGESKETMGGHGDYKEQAGEGITEPNYVGMVDKCSELRKQGLCLVPLSMLSNYLG